MKRKILTVVVLAIFFAVSVGKVYAADEKVIKLKKSTKLIKACQDEDWDLVKNLAMTGYDVNVQGNSGVTALYLACKAGMPEVAKILIAQGADPNLGLDRDKRTVLHWACMSFSDGEAVKMLVEKNAKVDSKDKTGATPLHYARTKEIAEVLVNAGADVNSRTLKDYTPLHYLAWSTCPSNDTCDLLISKGVDVNSRNNDGQTPLHFACRYGKLYLCRLLLSKGADVNAKDNAGKKPSEVLSTSDPSSANRIRYVLNVYGADLQPIQTTDINRAICNGDYKTVMALLEDKVNLEIASKSENPPLCAAASMDEEEVVRALLDRGADVNAKNWRGETALHQSRSRIIAEMLISHGADLNIRNRDLETPLNLLADRGPADIISLLVSKGADLETPDRYGKTPLLKASCYYYFAEPLINAGANVNVREKDGSTPLYHAALSHDIKLCELLLSKGADVNAKTLKAITALHQAALYQKVELCELLVSKGADVNARDENMLTPLHYAAQSGKNKYLKRRDVLMAFLIRSGSDPQAKDRYGRNPEYYTHQHGTPDWIEGIKFLLEMPKLKDI